MSGSFHITRALPGAGFDATVEAARAALAKEGFGILTEIDIAATLKAKLGVERPAYRILGACNPGYAHKALEIEDKIGALLPCNVIVQDKDGTIEVSAVDPVASLGRAERPELSGIAEEVRARLARAIAAL
ncbi:DUF302 domain-containing protein [Thermomonas sp. S9]|jgi:uncharacterized protein (DUF302 family)|uniref:DUF302 domain-containing protein n=1 Tax=Thermomonas sp. S9 TaxID=2885203 RepID=UPI00216AFAF7|nr:DUF302 domain-containing protein [Thermomonas sp. S9]MCR6495853.1 DUF302 domain-containing protein [Thermomonas sp. S9]